ncbi:hypothetical protein J3F84DRAFT_388188 [Trichoderma pleuroticola]
MGVASGVHLWFIFMVAALRHAALTWSWHLLAVSHPSSLVLWLVHPSTNTPNIHFLHRFVLLGKFARGCPMRTI